MEGILNLENWRKFGNDWVGYYIYPIQYCPICGKNLNKS